MKILESHEDVAFVQIGSHDGVTGDPIHNLIIENDNWHGILVEPVPESYKKLVQTYKTAFNADQRLILENSAISEVQEIKNIYCLSPECQGVMADILPLTYDQLSSFDKNHLVKGLGNQVLPYIQAVAVSCLSLQDLLDKHKFKNLDLLHIDVEGFDYKILKQLSFEKYNPSVILYEHAHLTESDKVNAVSLLKHKKYTVFPYRGDTLAVFEFAISNSLLDFITEKINGN